MRRIAYVLAAAAAFGTVTAPRLFAGDPPAASAEEQERIARLVEDLGSADFRVREAATKALIEFGAKARPALEKAVTSDNPAVRFRADQLLQGLDGKKGEQKLGEDARPGRSQPGAGGSTRDDVQRSVERGKAHGQPDRGKGQAADRQSETLGKLLHASGRNHIVFIAIYLKGFLNR